MLMPALQISQPVGGWARLDTRAPLESGSEEILSTPSARGGDILLGYLEATLADGQKEFVKIMLNEEIYIGREASCKLVVPQSYPHCSNWHFRIYSVVFDRHLQPLVYCQDLSLNGTLFNGRYIGNKNSILLSENDVLEIRHAAKFVFHAVNRNTETTQDVSYVAVESFLFSGTYTVTDRMLGAGGFGAVLLAREDATEQQVACKVVNLRSKKMKSPHEMLTKEVKILMNLNHPNIINVHKVYSTVDRIYIFEDLITGGDLWSHIERKGRLEETEALSILWQLVEALEYLHALGIAHRDLKPDNILLTSTHPGSRIILTDFGTAKQTALGSRMLTFVGTIEYTAPEITARKSNPAASGYFHSADLWSFGVILYMMLYGQPPFAPNGTEPSEAKNIHAMALKCDLSSLDTDASWQDASHEVKDLIRKTIVVDPLKRLDIGGVRRHPWFNRYREELEELYKHACHCWTRRESPVEWIEVIEGVGGRIINKTLGESPTTPTAFGGYQHGREQHRSSPLQTIAEPDENGRSGLEEDIDKFRIDSAAGCLANSPRIEEYKVEGKMELCESNVIVKKVEVLRGKGEAACVRHGSHRSRSGIRRGSRGNASGCGSGDVRGINPRRGRGRAGAGNRKA